MHRTARVVLLALVLLVPMSAFADDAADLQALQEEIAYNEALIAADPTSPETEVLATRVSILRSMMLSIIRKMR